MKHLFCSLFLLISFTGFSQEPPKAVVEVNKMNVVYRGVNNPLTLSMPGTVSFEASALGLKKVDDYGNYVMNPGSGLTDDIELRGKLPNGEIVTAIKTLRIKDIGRPIGTINGLGCGKKCILLLTKDELKDGKIDIKFEDWLFDWKSASTDFKIIGYSIGFNEETPIQVNGNSFTKDILEKINSTQIGSEIKIFNIKIHFKGIQNYKLKAVEPIRIKITED
ncbi:GldM family protein [Hanstruepera ponticola]|uniref:GldM family protein n=1 Tax=Hanstruepera ponticola TaxID=2042995 RepID=UPI0017832402|nr:GldM family protein [Hanstruepera ponticola]